MAKTGARCRRVVAILIQWKVVSKSCKNTVISGSVIQPLKVFDRIPSLSSPDNLFAVNRKEQVAYYIQKLI